MTSPDVPPAPRLATQDPTRLLAVVGLAGRFPGAPDLEAFWDLLDRRGDAIGPVPADRWDASAQLDPEKSIQAVGGFLADVDRFDPTFFGISPREAAEVDPQQRLFLEAAWKALEDGGVPAASLRGSRTGVYVGASWHDYEILRKERGAASTQHSAVGNALDVTAARVSYFLKLKGPSLVVETGCSSALVALHLAGQAVLNGELDGALVGGVNLILAPDVSVNLTHFGGLSKVGRSQAFSAKADGFVRGEGIVAVYLKRLDKALADGDRIRGVLVATAVNNDAGGESLVTPNPDGQTDLLTRVYADAGVDPDKLSYLEAHGTGTLRGDPIEAGAIGRTLAAKRSPDAGPLYVGSVKTNIGHLEATAGLAGLAKVLVSIEHGRVPASLHAEELNPEIGFDELNLAVARDGLDLPDPATQVSYLGVNSFGWGGTNAHVVVATPALAATFASGEDADAAPETGLPPVLAVTAHTDDALQQRAADLATRLDGATPAELADVAATLGRHRDHFAARAGVVAADTDAAVAALKALAAGEEDVPGAVTGRPRERGKVAFVFPGQGSQWAAMGAQLLDASPVFAATVARCQEALAEFVDWDLTEILAGRAGPGRSG
ncbi:MAG: beta-ketoacyl synthase N-terminal-like domain-containing protein [Kineosporiaceae bacterium]